MKIIINGLEVYGYEQPHGPQRFAYEILSELDKILEASDDIEIVIPKQMENYLLLKNIENIKIVGIDFDINKWKGRLRFNKIIFSRYVKKQKGCGVDLSLSFPLKHGDILCIYDCINKEYPDEAKGFKQKKARFLILLLQKLCINNAKIILTVSEYSRERINKLYNIPLNKIVVMGAAWQHMERIKCEAQILEKLNLKEGAYYFTAGIGIGRKNIKWILEAAKQNPESKFVIAGKNIESLLDSLNCKLENVVLAGYVSDGEYKALLKGCVAYIQPSFMEGFGIPPLEALSVGAEIIISDIAVFREIYENSAHYIQPKQYEKIDIQSIMASKTYGRDKVLNSYSWRKSAEILLKTIREYKG